MKKTYTLVILVALTLIAITAMVFAFLFMKVDKVDNISNNEIIPALAILVTVLVFLLPLLQIINNVLFERKMEKFESNAEIIKKNLYALETRLSMLSSMQALKSYQRLEHLKELRYMDQDNYILWNQLGVIYLKENAGANEKDIRKAMKKALDCFLTAKKILEKNTDNLQKKFHLVSVYINCSEAYCDLGRLDEAEELCKKALDLDNDNPNVYNMMGYIYKMRYRHETLPKNKKYDIYSMISYIYKRIFRHKTLSKKYDLLDKADKFIDKALDLDPNHGIAFSTKAEICILREREKEFEKNIIEALKKGCPVWDYMKAEEYVEIKDLEIKEAFEKKVAEYEEKFILANGQKYSQEIELI
jgi:tetratricopeptide (TPR) repeat protein